jgi:peptidyl-prolyl cis-trans isomerase D
VIAAFIGTIFLVWGQGGRQRQAEGRDVAAWVNGQPISFKSFENTYRNLYNRYKQAYEAYGMELTEDVLKNLRLDQQAINQLTRDMLLVQEARRYHLQVSDAELVNAIRKLPQFQRDNQFDPEVYKAILARVRLTPQEFEEQMTENLLVEKIEYLIQQTVRVTDQEVFEEYKVQNEKVQIEGIFVKPEQFVEKVAFTDADVAAYYDAHKETFKTPERRKIQYIYFDLQRIKDKITPTEEEIRQYYEDHETEFNKGKEVKASHILFRLDQDADKETEAAVKQKAEDVLQKLRAGADFAEMAKEYSEDPGSAKNGGDLGFFTKGRLVPEFEEAAFAMKVGEVSDLVRTQYGYHIIKVEEIREEPDPYGKAKPVIVERLKLEQAKERAAKQIEDSYQELLNTGSLQQVASNAGVDVHISQFFARGEPIDEQTGVVPQLQEVAFTLSADDKFSEPIETPLGYYLLEFLELKEPYIPELKEISEKVADRVRKEKAKELAKAEAEKIEEKLKNGTNWDEVIEKYSLEKFSPEPFSRRQRYISEFKEKSEDVIKIAFSLETQERSSVIELPENYCIIRVEKRIAIDEEKFKEEQEGLKQQLLQQKQATVVQEFVENLKQQADIQISKSITS